MITVYGIPNCDSVKKSRAWLTDQGLDYTFHDFKKQGVPTDRLDLWLQTLGWETLLNRKGTTWRKLDPSVQARVTDVTTARALMLAQPSVIKRPVVEWGTDAARTTVGFAPELFAAARRTSAA